MKKIAKIVGFIVNFFIAAPMLYGLIFALGVTNAVTTKEFMADLPISIIEQVPALIDEGYQAVVADTNLIDDENTKAWLEASAKTETTPYQLLENTGFFSWLENDVVVSLDSFGKALEGDKNFSSLTLNLLPVKEGFSSDEFNQYFESVLSNLPVCTPSQSQVWEEAIFYEKDKDYLPACQPSSYVSTSLINQVKEKINSETPDRLQFIKEDMFIPSGVNLSRMATASVALMFVLPLLFIILGSVLMSKNFAGFLKWSGITVLITGLLALLSATIPAKLTTTAVNNSVWWEMKNSSQYWTPKLQELVYQLINDTCPIITAKIFTPVIDASLAVIAFGLVTFSLSFVIGGNKETIIEEKKSNKRQQKETKSRSASIQPSLKTKKAKKSLKKKSTK